MRPPRSGARREAVCLLVVALLTAALFADGSLDIRVASWFYRPDAADHWPLARQLPWTLLYHAATWLTAALIVAGLAALGLSTVRAYRQWRRAAVLVLLAVALGPGLLGNALFKDHWQHPRPRELIEFGGSSRYVPSPLIGKEGGASLPCGHCTVGFLYGCGWWIWRRRRPQWAATSLAAGLLIGVLLGVGRLAAGAHFLSDVIWSALLAFGVVHVLDHGLLSRWSEASARIPQPSAARAPRPSARAPSALRVLHAPGALAIAAAAGGVAVLFALFLAPHGVAVRERVPLGASADGSPLRSLEVDGDTADVDIVLLDAPAAELAIDGELHGFAFPGSRLGAHLEAQPPATLRYRIEEGGWLTDVDASVRLRVPAAAFTRVSVAVRRGNIRVSDTTREGVLRAGRLQLELHAAHGSTSITDSSPRQP